MHQFEAELKEKIDAELALYSAKLAAVGRTFRPAEIEIWRGDAATYTSELRITILRDGQIDDVLEFHIFLNGEAQVTAQEAIEWVRSQLTALTSGGGRV